MLVRSVPHLHYVVGPNGSPLTVADLSSPATRRWVVRRKAEVVAAAGGGLLSLTEARKRYRLTMDEYLAWYHQVSRHGVEGLKTTKLQNFRNRSNPTASQA